MFAIDTAPDPALHLACSRIANRVVFLIRPLLRDADAIAREELERHGSAPEKTTQENPIPAADCNPRRIPQAKENPCATK